MSSSMEEGETDLRSFLPKWNINRDPPIRNKTGPKVRLPVRKTISKSLYPTVIMSHAHTVKCPKTTTCRVAEKALSSYNENSLSNQGPEYELVDAVDCIESRRYCLFHCNFIARIKNDSEAEDKLFFAEVKRLQYPGLSCLFCCILGPTDTKTGENGCARCALQPGLIQHPEDGYSQW